VTGRAGHTPKILFVAGEASGDAQAARLAAAVGRRRPDVRMTGVGGAQMREAGVRTFVDVSELSMMGISEVVSSLARIRRIYKRITGELRGGDPPSIVVLVDFPEFNLLLARAVRKAGIETFYYVSPQVWAWRRGRITKICRRVDRMVVLFPFEADLYADHGLDARFFGHPLAEEVVAERDRDETRARYGLTADADLVVLLPGSRKREVERLLPPMLEAASRLPAGTGIAIAAAPGLDVTAIERTVRDSGVRAVVAAGDAYNLIAAADAAVVASGTATVETALLGCPMVVVYKLSAFSYRAARALVRVSHIAMPNILAGRQVVPELIQDDASGVRIADELNRYLNDRDYREETVRNLAGIREALVRPGAAGRAAEFLLEGLP
jgi:lipid-A-disaccharide synthase